MRPLLSWNFWSKRSLMRNCVTTVVVRLGRRAQCSRNTRQLTLMGLGNLGRLDRGRDIEGKNEGSIGICEAKGYGKMKVGGGGWEC